MSKVLIGYYSRTGNTRKMARLVAEGIEQEGLKPDVKDIKDIQPADLLGYHAIIFGSPTYYGLMAAEMKKFIDETVKYHGKLAGKVGGAFTSSGGIASGAETTILSILEAWLVHGMIVMGEASEYHYGPAAVEAPDDEIKQVCINYGKKIAQLTTRLCS